MDMDPLHRETESERDWSDLNPDLLRLISRKISDVFDFVRFRTICKHWQYAAPASDHHPLLPCLFGRNFDYFLLYSLPSTETHKINLPIEARDWIFKGPIEHHLLVGTVNSVSLSLINPLTKNEVILPPINHNCFLHNWASVNPTRTWEHVNVIGYVGNNYTTYYNTEYLALYRHSEGNWVTIEKDLTGRYPIVYYKGMYYCVISKNGATEVIDATTGEIVSTIPSPRTSNDDYYTSTYKHYFVESSGDLLLICKFPISMSSSWSVNYYFDIYRLNQENDDHPQWVKMSNMADQAFFLGATEGFSVKSTDFDRFKGNCIYYIEYAFKEVEDSYPHLVNHLLRYDIEDRCWEELPYPFKEAVTWIMPSLH